MAKLDRINIFLSAKTPAEIVGLELLNNAVNGIQYAYQTPVWTGKEWVIWFFADVDSWVNPSGMSEDAKQLTLGFNQ